MTKDSIGNVFLIKTTNRDIGIRRLFEEFNPNFSGKRVSLKANFNSADPFPASTHPDTLRAIVENLKKIGANSITLAERSGMGTTRRVLQELGIFDLGERLGFEVVVSDELNKADWVAFDRKGTHWLNGFCIARCFIETDIVVQTCCLKTHRFGGHFTMALKNSVGLVAKRIQGEVYDYMWELHSSPFQRQMIAEINKQYDVDIVIMDGIRAFISGGPENGEIAEPNLLLASKDRVALDAVGVAILRIYGAKGNVAKGKIFEQDQLRRAAELEIGVKSSKEINLKALNSEAKEETERIISELESG